MLVELHAYLRNFHQQRAHAGRLGHASLGNLIFPLSPRIISSKIVCKCYRLAYRITLATSALFWRSSRPRNPSIYGSASANSQVTSLDHVYMFPPCLPFSVPIQATFNTPHRSHLFFTAALSCIKTSSYHCIRTYVSIRTRSANDLKAIHHPYCTAFVGFKAFLVGGAVMNA